MKKAIRNALETLAILSGLYFGGRWLINESSKTYLKDEVFENMQWCEVRNYDGIVWDNYMRTNIPKNQVNWAAYVSKVKERNQGRLEGQISVPCETQNL